MVFIRSIAVGGFDTDPSGITTDGKYLWMTGETNNSIYQLDKTGNLIRTIAVGGFATGPRGITTDGKYLWICGAIANNIYQLDKFGNLIQTINTGTFDNFPQGITTDGKYLWIVGTQNANIYQLDKFGNLIKIHKSLSVAARRTHVTKGNISKAMTGKHHSSGGFLWQKVNNPKKIHKILEGWQDKL